ncbi:MAG: hypothetical protein QOH05_1945, partial [Acetobacteraceae bacterium]|nr:hypothetical protein [Acetobacteraceae bacterium]
AHAQGASGWRLGRASARSPLQTMKDLHGLRLRNSAPTSAAPSSKALATVIGAMSVT